MLHHPRMEAVGKAVDRVALGVDAFVADVLETRHHAAQTGHRQAAFPTLLKFAGCRRDHRVEQDGLRHRLGIRVTLAALEAEDHQLQVDTDLWCGQAHATHMAHGFEHIFDQLLQFGTAEHVFGHWRGDAQQAFVAHLENVTDHRGFGSEGWCSLGIGCSWPSTVMVSRDLCPSKSFSPGFLPSLDMCSITAFISAPSSNTAAEI
ncbi:hypothetical protein D9M71_474700 [compost metagenome]